MMQKEGKVSEKESIEYLNQLIRTLDESIMKLEIAYEKKDNASFDKLKKFILEIFNRISEINIW